MAAVSVIYDIPDATRWQKLASAVLANEGAPEDAEITLLFVDEARMSELNKQHMNESDPTDVLAFPIDESWRDDRSLGNSSAAPALIGDVVICPEQCRDADGIAMRVVHGVLHLCGYDHAEEQERSHMFNLQQQYLSLFDTL